MSQCESAKNDVTSDDNFLCHDFFKNFQLLPNDLKKVRIEITFTGVHYLLTSPPAQH